MRMELLNPSHIPGPTRDGVSGFSPPGNLRRDLHRMSCSAASEPLEIAEEGGDLVHVAVGKSMRKGLRLLKWTFQRFENREICFVHVHQPSSVIPTLLGKLPASQANGEVVSLHRREEKEKLDNLLSSYLNICSRSKVKASYIMIEADQVDKGIVDLVNKHRIKKLVMGAVPRMRNKINKKANYAAKYASPFCEIWFINKGHHLWTREASADLSFLEPVIQQQHVNSASSSIGTVYTSSAEISVLTDSDMNNPNVFKPRVEEESLNVRIREARSDAEASKSEAIAEKLKCELSESEAVDAIDKVRAFESAHAHELNLRKEAEEAVRTTILEQQKLIEESENVTKELEKTMRGVALLDRHAEEAKRRCEEATEELRFIEASIATLQREKQMIQRQKLEGVHWLEQWRSRGKSGATKGYQVFGVVDSPTQLAEFSLSDLESATCNFSESFKIGQGGYGCVYKGEMMGRTVAIKKLHPHNLQGQSEFQQEVQVLGKLRHPHLVTLIGACPEAWSLVYEYLPNGSLQDHLFRKSNPSCLTWKIRTRIVAEISSAILFLHSSKPSKVVHGNLKPENILLNSELSCKICDFGICRLVPEESLCCPSFHQYTEPKSAFPYTDPEFHRTGVLTPKSDVYAFGLITMQLLTGRPPLGLVSEVRKAVLCGKLESILDSSAGEWPIFVAKQLVDLGLQSCELNSRDRPELRPTLVTELEQLHVSEERSVPLSFLCPILREIMHDPQIAADGFTYEGEALRGWLENGRETSPMTNLKLSHLHLTPNHALRLAIQEWLCKS